MKNPSHVWFRKLAVALLLGICVLNLPRQLRAVSYSYQNLTVGPSGALAGGLGEVFNVRGNLINNSTQNTVWDTHLAQIGFNAIGPHQLTWSEAEMGRGNAGFINNFATAIFVVPSGATITTAGIGSLYTRELILGDGVSQIASITGSRLNIHYNPGSPQNAYLNFQTYSLPNGFTISPAAAPADVNAVWNGSTGNWTDTSRWSSSPNYPLNSSTTVTLYDATINGGIVTLNQPIPYIQKLDIGSGATLSGPAGVTPWDTFTWGTPANNNASTIGGQAIVNANGDIAMVGDSARNLDNATVNNHVGYIATWTVGNSDVNFSNGAVFNNYGSFIAQNNRTLGHNGGTGTFNNYGTFTMNTGTGKTNIGGENFVFNSSGAINVQAGSLEFDGPLLGSLGSSMSVSNGANMVIAHDASVFGGSITTAGPFNIGDSNGGANTASLKLLANGQINNSSVLTVSSDGLLDLNGFSESVGSIAVISGNVTVGTGTITASNLSMSGGTISGTANGKLQLGGNVSAISDSNQNFAAISTQTDLNAAIRTFMVNHGPGAQDLLISGTILNGGITKNGAGTMTIIGPTTYTGTTAVNAGVLTINGHTFSSTGSTIAAGATLSFVNGESAGNGTFADAGSANANTSGGLIQFSDNNTAAGTGSYTISGATGTVASGGNGATLVFNSGTTADHATVAVQGAPSRYAGTSAQALFNGGSSAGHAIITAGGGTDSGSDGGVLRAALCARWADGLQRRCHCGRGDARHQWRKQ